MYYPSIMHTMTSFMQKDPQMCVLLPAVHININNIINLLFIVGFCGVSWDKYIWNGRCAVHYSIQLQRTEKLLGRKEHCFNINLL